MEEVINFAYNSFVRKNFCADLKNQNMQKILFSIEREANSVKFIEKTKSKVIKPRCILIFGRSNDWNDEQREAYRILNAAYNQISILTYDHLLFRAKNVLGITEDIDTTDDDELPF